ncbi:MAG: hypothetical protein ABIQ93_14215 [Saprospiraceae bacterium]
MIDGKPNPMSGTELANFLKTLPARWGGGQKKDDLPLLSRDASQIVKAYFPDFEEVFARQGWKMFPTIGRVYVNEKARRELDWRPKYDFRRLLDRVRSGEDFRSPLSRLIGEKGYHR